MNATNPNSENNLKPSQHIELLFGTRFPGYVQIWRQDTKQTRSFSSDELESLDLYVREVAQLADTYFEYGLQTQPIATSKRGRAKEVSAIGCLWFDLDHYNSNNPNAHKQSNLPQSREEALEFASYLPIPPSMIINSGNGLYLNWRFDELQTFTTDADRNEMALLSQDLQRFVISKGKERGWNLDSTGDLCRLTRPINSFNWKGQPLPVTLIELNDLRYTVEGIRTQIPTTQTAPIISANDNSANNDNEPNYEQMSSECSFIRHWEQDAATLPEPHWKHGINIISLCSDGSGIIHTVSANYPGYSHEETEKKINEAEAWGKPTTCQYVENELGWAGCKTCKHRETIRSPILLGLPISLFKNWVYVTEIKRFIDIETGRTLDKEGFSDLFRHVFPKSAAMTLLKSRIAIKVDRPGYRPGSPLYYEANGVSYLNRYRESGIVPIEGDAQPFFQHIEYLIPDPLIRTSFLNVIAHIAQKPGERINYMTVLRSVQGTGKSYLVDAILTPILGAHNTSIIESGELKLDFNGWVTNVCLVVIEELMAKGKIEVMNNLKAKITQDSIRVNEKNITAYEIENHVTFLGFTNHSNPIHIERSDRRIFFINSPAMPRDSEYYDHLFTWTQKNIGVIYHALLSLDLSGFNPKGHAPMTQAKLDVIEESVPSLERQLQNMIDDETHPVNQDVVTVSQIAQSFSFGNRYPSDPEIGTALRNLGAIKLDQFRLSNGERPRLWVVRNFDKWVTNDKGKQVAANKGKVEAEYLRKI